MNHYYGDSGGLRDRDCGSSGKGNGGYERGYGGNEHIRYRSQLAGVDAENPTPSKAVPASANPKKSSADAAKVEDGKGNETERAFLDEDLTVLEGLEGLVDIRKLGFVEKESTRGRKDTLSVEICKEDGTRMFTLEATIRWAGIRCQVLSLDSTPVLQIVVKTTEVACLTRKSLTVTHLKSKILLGSIKFSKSEAIVYDAWKNKVLRILKKITEGKEDELEFMVVETDNTRVATITGTGVKYSKYIDLHQRAVLLGGWLPTGVLHYKGV